MFKLILKIILIVTLLVSSAGSSYALRPAATAILTKNLSILTQSETSLDPSNPIKKEAPHSIYNRRAGGLRLIPGKIVAVILSPFAILVIISLAIAIKITSEGPAFFSQIRVGYQGKPIKVYKLRTMTNEADPEKRKETAIGRPIRFIHLDETPQLFSIIKGDMQWVGPRPLLEWQVSKTYEDTILFMTLPGIFSRSALIRTILSIHLHPAMETIEYDWRDIENSSFLYNSRLILKSIFIISQIVLNRLFARGRNLNRDKLIKLVAPDFKQAESIFKPDLPTFTVSGRQTTETITDILSADSSKDVRSGSQKSRVQLKSPKAAPVDGLKLKVDVAFAAAA